MVMKMVSRSLFAVGTVWLILFFFFFVLHGKNMFNGKYPSTENGSWRKIKEGKNLLNTLPLVIMTNIN